MSVSWEFGVPCYSYSYSCSCSVVGNRCKKYEYEEKQENGGRRQPSSNQVTQGTGSDSLARLRTAVTSAMTPVGQDSPSSHFGT